MPDLSVLFYFSRVKTGYVYQTFTYYKILLTGIYGGKKGRKFEISNKNRLRGVGHLNEPSRTTFATLGMYIPTFS